MAVEIAGSKWKEVVGRVFAVAINRQHEPLICSPREVRRARAGGGTSACLEVFDRRPRLHLIPSTTATSTLHYFASARQKHISPQVLSSSPEYRLHGLHTVRPTSLSFLPQHLHSEALP